MLITKQKPSNDKGEGQKMKNYFPDNENIHFVDRIDGDCVNERDGVKIENGIKIPISVKAPSGCDVLLNGKPMSELDGIYTAEIELYGYRNTLLAEDRTNNQSATIRLFYLKDAIGKFRFSSDDNILFLCDINEHKDEYKSIFDNPYLAIYKKAHDLYGAKVHLNLFYEFGDKSKEFFSSSRPYFNLSMMTDKFKDEFKANSDWLKLAFHANSEFPDRPYDDATPEKIVEDCIRIHREIIRFAGKDSISNSTTTHWGSGNLECIRALRSLGYTSFTGYFEVRNGKRIVSYYAPVELCHHLNKRDFWCDTEEDVFFACIDRVSNVGPLESVMNDIEKAASDPLRGGFVSVMIHEQYFYSDYIAYLPDFEKRILEPCRYLSEHGYIPAHVTEITREPNLNENIRFSI